MKRAQRRELQTAQPAAANLYRSLVEDGSSGARPLKATVPWHFRFLRNPGAHLAAPPARVR